MSKAEPRVGAKGQALPRKGSKSGGKRKKSKGKPQKRSGHKRPGQKKSHKKRPTKKKSKSTGKAGSAPKPDSRPEPKPVPKSEPAPEPAPKPAPKLAPPPRPVAETRPGLTPPAPASPASTVRQQVVAELLGALGAPYVGWQVAKELWATTEDSDDNPILSFGGGVTEWVAGSARARWMRRSGMLGLAYNCYLGHGGALASPPGGPWLLSRLGLRNTTLAVLAMMAGGLALLGLFEASLFTLLVAPFALGNRALLDPLLRIGRVETLAWGLVVLAAGALAMGFTMVVAMLVAVAMCIAPLPATVGAVALLGCMFSARGMTFGLVEYLLLVAPVAVFWWWPCLAHGREKVGLETADAAAAPDWQAAHIKKLDQRVRALVRPAAALVLAAVFLGGAGFATLGLVLVVAGGLWMLSRERYLLHPSTFDLAVMVCGLLAVGWSEGIVTPIVFLVVLWFLHGVEPSSHEGTAYVRPLRFQSQLESIRYLAAELPDTSRVALEFHGWHDGLNWLVARALADRDGVELLSGVARDQVAPDVTDGYERYMNLEDGTEKLLERMDRVGVGYLITYTPELAAGLLEAGFVELRTVELNGFERHGCFQEGQTFTLRLLQAPGHFARIAPATALEKKPNHISFEARGGQRYLLKYAHYRGWKATDADGRELLVDDAYPGMWITVPQDTTVQVRYSWWNYFGR